MSWFSCSMIRVCKSLWPVFGFDVVKENLKAFPCAQEFPVFRSSVPQNAGFPIVNATLRSAEVHQNSLVPHRVGVYTARLKIPDELAVSGSQCQRRIYREPALCAAAGCIPRLACDPMTASSSGISARAGRRRSTSMRFTSEFGGRPADAKLHSRSGEKPGIICGSWARKKPGIPGAKETPFFQNVFTSIDPENPAKRLKDPTSGSRKPKTWGFRLAPAPRAATNWQAIVRSRNDAIDYPLSKAGMEMYGSESSICAKARAAPRGDRAFLRCRAALATSARLAAFTFEDHERSWSWQQRPSFLTAVLSTAGGRGVCGDLDVISAAVGREHGQQNDLARRTRHVRAGFSDTFRTRQALCRRPTASAAARPRT